MMMMKFQVFGILLFLVYTLSYPSLLVFSSPSSLLFPNSSSSSSSSQLCHHHDKVALLRFKNGFTIDPQFSERYEIIQYYGISSYPKTKSWKEDRDCCLWDGVTCDTVSGHVIGLDLSFSQLGGIIHQNSTLFHLSHLQVLNLAFNDFNFSHISPNIANFASLKVLNLSYSVFTGDVPINLGLLSQLISLDLSSYNYNIELEMSNIDKIMRNLTSLRELILNSVSINSAFPQAVANLSSLSSLELYNCNLQGSFPSNIFTLPHLHSLIVGGNDKLYIDASHFSNLSSSLEVMDFSYSSNLTGKLPEYSLGSQPPQLRTFSAYSCNLYGNIPMWIWNTTHEIDLGGNSLSGKLPSSVNTNHLSGLTSLHLEDNLLNGTIPSWLMNLPSLNYLDLSSNQFTGEVPEPFPKGNCLLEELYLENNNLSLQLNFLSKCNNLEVIRLSHTSLIGVNNSTFFWPNLTDVYMSSCNITSSFPNFLHSQLPLLRHLYLSNNKIQGEIPTWFYNVGKNSLFDLNISHNNLTGGLDLRSWKNLENIDIRSNSLQGLLPLPPPNTTGVFLASNNKFHGEINSSFCDLGMLYALDLSYNHLNGTIPKCKLFRGGLQVLNLRSNRFRGVLPLNFTNDCKLESMSLNDNLFEGKVPRSLKRCKALEVLDLGNNQLNDTFPHALGTLPHLKVLVLRSNHFQGLIKYHPKAHIKPFPKLQILDISRNQFCGKLPTRYIENFKAMMVSNNVGANNNNDRYIGMSNVYSNYYHDSLVLTVKGTELSYERILSILASLDFSSNNFSGDIPNSVGQLVTLIGLNMSHNNLRGHIPPCLANLSSLEFLDLSCNKLEGEIPPQLVSLTFLAVFNVSNNKLDGPIPQGSQFGTFLNDSYEGNLGLCGDPLPKCGEHGGALDHQPTTPESQQQGSNFIDIITSISLCEIILLGFGLGTVLGSSIGYCMLSARKSNWLSRKADRFEGVMMRRFKKRSGRKQRT